ncbi:GspE/PulE family protein [Alkalimarinus coralli]|uniref:GspE/PulE family protein n=1 Tax=Alkalimarinus coralli TaxID=2935863 RepID=UPI00202B69A6|nr:type II/IV secretion system protein [Alkalimarinus coralli]
MADSALDDLGSDLVSLPLGQILIKQGSIQPRDLEKALVVQKQLGGRLGGILVRSGSVSESNLLKALKVQLDLKLVGLDIIAPKDAEIEAALEATKLSANWLLQQEVIVWVRNDILFCLAKDPLSPLLDETLTNSSKLPVEYCLSRSQVIDSLLASIKVKQSERELDVAYDTDIQQLRELAEEAPVIELVNNIISQALEERASDIHIEPEEDTFDVRYRIDGVMFTNRTLPKQRYYAIASRLKLISGIDIAERRLPQDGRIGTRINGLELDVRVSSLPGVHGESIVMRLLPKERQDMVLDRLGFLPDHLSLLRQWVAQPHGIVLVTGPTGSGKSTTLYSALDESNDGVKKMITVEDPVEFRLPHITQVQVHSDIGLTFSAALRSILRQDPDVIMIGEIRDLETAEIAVQSALTGHLVLSTLHTNDAMSAFSRLMDMGVEPFLAATPVIAVQAQRLVRRLCDHCCEPVEVSDEITNCIRPYVEKLYPSKKPRWHHPVGCEFCQYTGYKGRLGIYELVDINESMRELVMQRAPLAELQKKARQDGYRDLYTDGLIKAWKGLTSVEEVHRVASLHV